MRYHVIDTTTGAIVKELATDPSLAPLKYKPRGRVSSPKRSYTKKRPGIYLNKEAAWTVAIVIFLFGICIGHY